MQSDQHKRGPCTGVVGFQAEKIYFGSWIVNCLFPMLRGFLDDPDEFKALSQENLHQIQPWNW